MTSHARCLWQLHASLNSFNLQATLIVGFALGTLNADNLVAISDDLSKYCLYKQPFVSGLYIVLTIVAIGTCMTCLGLSFYIIVRSQQTANEVSVTHTVALVRQLQSQIVFYYFMGVLAFFVSLLLIIIMYERALLPTPPPCCARLVVTPLRVGRYIGRHNWIPLPPIILADNTTWWATGSTTTSTTCNTAQTGLTGNPSCDSYIANGWDTPVLQTNTNEMLITCLNPYSSAHQHLQHVIGLTITIVAGITFVVMGVIGYSSFRQVRDAFQNMSQMASQTMGGQ